MRERTGGAMVRWVPACWSFLLALLLLGGALGRGYVLVYDMVWVPDLALGLDALGLGTALPRAVPSDAVVAVLDEVIRGEVLQKMVLVGALVSAGTGAARLCGRGVVARLVTTTVFVWNPFVVERLALGHWPVLVGYGLVPWVILAGVEWRATRRFPPRLPLLLVLGSLSATTGLVTAAALCAAAGTRSVRQWAWLAVAAGAANAPWVISGVLHAGTATSSAAGADVFAPSDREGLLRAPLHFLTLGGVWNAESVPASRTGWLGVAVTLVILVLSAVALRRGWAAVPPPVRWPLVSCWAIGMTLTLATWALPGVTGWIADTVPGGGLLRDGSRVLALSAPLVAALAGRGADVVAGLMPDASSRIMVGLGCVLAPLALMPDAALGLSGRLAAAEYPVSYHHLVTTLPSLPEGDVVILPFESYRAPTWNGGRPVLSPLARYLRRDVVVEDQLIVDGRRLPGEDPRAAEVRQALDRATAEQRSLGLRGAGVRLVVIEDIEGLVTPEVDGDVAWRSAGLEVVDVGPGVESPVLPTAATVAMGLAWSVWLAATVSGPLLVVLRKRRAKMVG